MRFIGSNRSAPIILNYLKYGITSMDKLIGLAACVTVRITYTRLTYKGPVTFFHNPFVFEDSPAHPERAAQYLETMLFVVDMCQHTRDMIDYVKTATSELYAKRLILFLRQIDSLLADLNPTRNLIAMRWLMYDFHKIPRQILDDWLAA